MKSNSRFLRNPWATKGRVLVTMHSCDRKLLWGLGSVLVKTPRGWPITLPIDFLADSEPLIRRELKLSTVFSLISYGRRSARIDFSVICMYIYLQICTTSRPRSYHHVIFMWIHFLRRQSASNLALQVRFGATITL